VILPEAAPTGLVRLIEAEAREMVEPDAIRRLAALLPADPAVADHVASRLRLSIAQKKRLILAAKRDGAGSEARTLAYAVGREAAIDRLLLTGETIAPLHGWENPVFPLKGGAIVARGVAAGPEVAKDSPMTSASPRCSTSASPNSSPTGSRIAPARPIFVCWQFVDVRAFVPST
jgi:poly(A) polymerase